MVYTNLLYNRFDTTAMVLDDSPMTEYVPYIVFGIAYTVLGLIGLWSLRFVIWGLFGDLIKHRQQINESRKKWKNK